jgi:polar amino acid transport system permease protein
MRATMSSVPTPRADDVDGLALLPLRRRRSTSRVVIGAVLLLVIAYIAQQIIRNPVFQWSTVWHYMGKSAVLKGVLVTLEITVVSMAVATLLGLVLAVMRMSSNPVAKWVSWGYVWLFRSVPLLVQLILWYNFALIYKHLGIGLPFGKDFAAVTTQSLITPFVAAILAFGLHEAAYLSEVFRASLMSLPRGQQEAGKALGMTSSKTFRIVLLPQAARIALPPFGNHAINMLKSTALVAFISVYDLLYTVQQIYNRTFEVMPLLMVATIWYVILVSITSFGQSLLERRLQRGHNGVRKVAVRPVATEALPTAPEPL